ncbi:MAG: hypothetical protein ACN6O2_01380 [Stenotrophomonas sp.]
MIDMASLSTAVSSLGATLGVAKAALEIRDFNASAAAISEISQKVIDLQGQLLAAQSALFHLHQEKVALAQEVRELKEERADRESYSLFEISPSVFVQRFNGRPKAAGTEGPSSDEPPHYLCQPCWSTNRKVVLQKVGDVGHITLDCPVCKGAFRTGEFVPYPEPARFTSDFF